jgi:hypothetical protein
MIIQGDQQIAAKQGDSGELEVKLNGSLVKLASITTDTTVTAGSLLTLLPSAVSRLDYKAIRITVKWSTATPSTVNLYYVNASGGQMTTGLSTMLTLSTVAYGSAEAIIHNEWYAVTVQNASSSDAVLRYAEVLGVR